MTDQARAEIDRGLKFLQAEDPESGLASFEAALAISAGDTDAISLSGVALSILGRKADAEAQLERAIALAPQALAYRINRIDHWIRFGALRQAEQDCLNLLAADQSSFLALDRLGDIKAGGEDHAAAEAAYRRALKINPGAHEVVVKFVRSLIEIGDLDMAKRALKHAKNLRPDDSELLFLDARIAFADADWAGASALCERFLEAAAPRPDVLMMLANAKSKVGDYDAAAAHAEEALSLGTPATGGLVFLATLLMYALSFERAEAVLLEAEQRDPANAAVASTMALLRMYQGRRDEAEALCEKALACDPGEFSIYPRLSALRSGRLKPQEEAQLEIIKNNGGFEIGQRATASFILAHHYDAAGDYGRAFAEYKSANSIAMARNTREGFTFDPDAADVWTASLIDLFASPPSRQEATGEHREPIFIVGLPRCGSTLVEGVLSAHSNVEAGGEMPMMPRIFAEWIKQRRKGGGVAADSEELARLRGVYEAGLPSRSLRTVDKNLLNVEAVGLIVQMYPGAKVVHLRRRPLDAVLAIFRQDLPKFWSYATSIDWITQRYIQVARLTASWEKRYPENFTTVQYEDFAAQFEPSAQALLSFCGLEWEAACLEFQKSEHVAATISAVQVREPVAPRTARSQAYARELEAVGRTFENAGIDLQTGAIKE